MSKKRPRVFVSFGHNLRLARTLAKLTQEALAYRLGFTRATAISLWERSSTHIPEPKTIRKIAAAIGCSTADLLRNVPTEYDRLRGTAIVLAPEDLIALDAATPADDEEVRLLQVWRQLHPATRGKFMSLFEHMVEERAPGDLPDGRAFAGRLAPPPPSAAASARSGSPRRRRRAS